MSGTKKRKPFDLEHWDDVLKSPTPGYIVDDLIPESSTVVVLGRWKTGKTFLGLGAAFACVAGLPFLGRSTRPGPVIYVHAEGTAQVRKRLLALSRFHGIETNDGLYIVRRPVRLLDDEHDAHLRASIRSMPRKPTIIFFDTFARCILPANENDNCEVNGFVDRVEALRSDFGCSVVLVHHPGHGDSSQPRGASSILASADAVLRLEPNGPEKDGRLDLVCGFLKDGEPFEPIGVRREVIHLGPDERGRQQSSCVIVESDHAPKGSTSLIDRILDGVRENPRITTKDLAEFLGTTESNLRNKLPDLVREGKLIAEGDRPKQYRRPE
ncbi:MAG: AAA family ATPase [Planctomycetota bacterium JB042]